MTIRIHKFEAITPTHQNFVDFFVDGYPCFEHPERKQYFVYIVSCVPSERYSLSYSFVLKDILITSLSKKEKSRFESVYSGRTTVYANRIKHLMKAFYSKIEGYKL